MGGEPILTGHKDFFLSHEFNPFAFLTLDSNQLSFFLSLVTWRFTFFSEADQLFFFIIISSSSFIVLSTMYYTRVRSEALGEQVGKGHASPGPDGGSSGESYESLTPSYLAPHVLTSPRSGPLTH